MNHDRDFIAEITVEPMPEHPYGRLRRRKLSDTDRTEIIRLGRAGRPINMIAAWFHVSRSTIDKILKDSR